MEQSFSTLSILGMIFNVFAGIGVPILLVVLIKKKYEMRIGPLFVGACAYIAANMFLQGIVDTSISLITPFATFLMENDMPRVIIISILHGAVQLGGYYLIIHMFMKDFRRKENSLLFGVGIRIIDSIMTYGVGSGIYMLIFASAINAQGLNAYLAAYEAGSAEAEAARESLVQMIEMPVIEIIGVGLICICFIFVSIAVSVLVFQVAKRPNKMYLLPTAGAISILNCLLPELYSAGKLGGIATFIILFALLAILSCVIAFFVYKNDTDEERGKADIVIMQQVTESSEMSMREKIARVNKSSTPGDKE